MEEKIIEYQIKLFMTIKTKLDHALGENSYPISVAEKILYEINKDLRTALIQDSKNGVKRTETGQGTPKTAQTSTTQAQVDHTPQTQETPLIDNNPYTDVHCIQCERKLRTKEVKFCNDTGLENVCYHCRKGIKRSNADGVN